MTDSLNWPRGIQAQGRDLQLGLQRLSAAVLLRSIEDRCELLKISGKPITSEAQRTLWKERNTNLEFLTFGSIFHDILGIDPRITAKLSDDAETARIGEKLSQLAATNT